MIATNACKISCDIAASFVKALKSLVINGWVQEERGTSLPGGGTPCPLVEGQGCLSYFLGATIGNLVFSGVIQVQI